MLNNFGFPSMKICFGDFAFTKSLSWSAFMRNISKTETVGIKPSLEHMTFLSLMRAFFLSSDRMERNWSKLKTVKSSWNTSTHLWVPGHFYALSESALLTTALNGSLNFKLNICHFFIRAWQNNASTWSPFSCSTVSYKSALEQELQIQLREYP